MSDESTRSGGHAGYAVKDRMPRNFKAFTVLDLLMLLAVLAIAAMFLLPMMNSRPRRAPRIHCVNNLKQVGVGFQVWASDNGDRFPMEVSQTSGGTLELSGSGLAWPHFQNLSNLFATPKMLVCVKDESRVAATNFASDFNNAHLSYFLNLDATCKGTNMIMSGDRNISLPDQPARRVIRVKWGSPVKWTAAIHADAGNVLMTDGSVRQTSTSALRATLKTLPEDGVRLAFP